ncbi:MAG: DUF255 domain-containing protein, partial [Gammaproteobacteria bacterium]|nr:DUF255 domain-containing protein [Gammaproteobacteria bacterium]
LILLILTPLHATPAPTPLGNQLKHHPSPYLALHGNDPVHWQDWGAAVIERARAENKLIFISSGYFSCHWCHVMQRESYSDLAVADLLNKLAIPVKIDRELQPALDSWLIDFTERTAGQAGWPLNVFLTPDGYPLIGITYLPKAGFSDLLGKLQTRWNEDEEYLRATALNAFESLRPEPKTHSGRHPEAGMDQVLAKLMVSQAMQIADETAGGFGDQNKFPMSPQISVLLEIQASFPDEKLGDFLKLTLDQMSQLGLRDHVGGGFFRYTVDPAWDTPHFEKMLYDNAQLIGIYLRAAEVLKQPDYLQVALDTLEFVIDSMHNPAGGYVASLSAVDNMDIEGGYYLWQLDELKSILDENEFTVVSNIWGTKGTPYLEAGHHLKYVNTHEEAAQQLNIPVTDIQDAVSSARHKLSQARKHRILPVDNKVLAAWNGLLLNSMGQAVIKTGNDRYRDAAEKLYHLLSNQLWDGGQLHRFMHGGNAGGRVSLEDYAYVSQGIASWAKASGDLQARDTARAIALAGLQRFHNQNGWQLSEELIIPYDARELVLADHTMPSPSATLLGVLFNVAQQQHDDKLKGQVLPYIDVELTETVSAPLWYGSHILLIHRVLQKDKIL